jgi:hypothetical protein
MIHQNASSQSPFKLYNMLPIWWQVATRQQGTVDALAIMNMTCIAFFFLCQPSEYTAPTSENTPFQLRDITFYIGLHATTEDLAWATFVCLVFTRQKNSVQGKAIGLGLSGDPFACPMLAVARQVSHLFAHQAPSKNPSCTFYSNNKEYYVTPTSIVSTTLKESVMALGTILGLDQTEVSTQSLQGGSARALFMCPS